MIYKEPIAVRGAFDFKLVDMAMALNRAGVIDLDLGDLPAFPSRAQSAMAGAWSAAAEATERGRWARSSELTGASATAVARAR